MKNTGPLLIGLTVAAIIGVGVYAYLDSFRDGATQSEEEFLAESRDAANAAPESPGEKNATLPPASSGAGSPQIEIESDVLDMGLIANDKIAEREFKIRNLGNAPLEITEIKTSCHCTEGEMKDKIVPPGGEGIMRITVDPFRIPMFTSRKTLTVSSNDPKKPEIAIDVTANVVPEVSWEPKLLDFGSMPKGTPAELSLVIREETAPFTIARAGIAGSKLDALKATFVEVTPGERKDPSKTEFKITIASDGQLPAGELTAQLIVSLDGIKRIPRISIPIKIGITAAYTIEPSMITLRSVTPGETLAGVLTLTSQVPVEITKLEALNPALSVKTRPGDAPNTVVFDLTVAADATERVQRDTWAFVVTAGGAVFEEKIKVLAILKEQEGIGAPAAPLPAPNGAPAPGPAPTAPAPQ